MKIKISKLKQFINTCFNGNQTECAVELDINRSYLNQILNKKQKLDSSKLCNAMIKYCKNNDLNESEYIIF